VDKLPVDEVPGLLDELKGFFTDNKLSERHLRMASSTVKAINRLEDGDKREEYFQQFGELFEKSESKELARYGKKVGKKPKVKTPSPDLTGKPLELEGVTALGTEFDWTVYRGKTVLVLFWATRCRHCQEQMPEIKALHERLGERGFDIVGISLDRSQEALAKYLEENAINWTNLVGKEVRNIIKKYSIRGVPTMILVDREGNVVTLGNKIAELTPQIENLLGTNKS
jgi:thiol-disulfide isomerase/thioredoxin